MQIKQLGMTVIELMVTIAVLAVVFTLGVPSFQHIMRTNQLAAHTNSFLSSLNFARSEAINRKQNVVICESDDAASCDSGNGFQNGWLIFADVNRNDSFDGGTDVSLWVGSPLESNLTLHGSSSEIVFRSTGRPNGFGENIVLCKDNDLNYSRKLVLSSSGNVRLADQSEITTCTP